MANNITLDEIVKNVLSDQEKYTTHEYARLLNLANRGLKELTYDVLNTTKVIILQVDTDLRVDLPDDFIDYTFIGTINSGSQLEPLGRSKSIPVNGSTNTSTESPREFAYLYGGLFGLGGGQNSNGYYSPQIDTENWQIVFASTSVGQTIYLEYISDGRESTNNAVVHPYAQDALESYVYWRSILRKRTISQVEKDRAERIYYRAKAKARARLVAFTKDELLQQIRKGFKQSPKA